MTIRLRSVATSTARRVERLARRPDLALEAARADRRLGVEVAAARCASTRMFSGATCCSSARTRSTSGQKPLVDDQHAGARLIEHAGQHLAAQAGVDAEQRQAGVRAAAEQRQQLEMVLEHHRHVAGPLLVDRARDGGAGSAPCAPTRRGTARYVQRAIALHEEGLLRRLRMLRPRLDLLANGKACLECQRWCCHFGVPPRPVGVTRRL